MIDKGKRQLKRASEASDTGNIEVNFSCIAWSGVLPGVEVSNQATRAIGAFSKLCDARANFQDPLG